MFQPWLASRRACRKACLQTENGSIRIHPGSIAIRKTRGCPGECRGRVFQAIPGADPFRRTQERARNFTDDDPRRGRNGDGIPRAGKTEIRLRRRPAQPSAQARGGIGAHPSAPGHRAQQRLPGRGRVRPVNAIPPLVCRQGFQTPIFSWDAGRGRAPRISSMTSPLASSRAKSMNARAVGDSCLPTG